MEFEMELNWQSEDSKFNFIIHLNIHSIGSRRHYIPKKSECHSSDHPFHFILRIALLLLLILFFQLAGKAPIMIRQNG